jgi:hypothetical protein
LRRSAGPPTVQFLHASSPVSVRKLHGCRAAAAKAADFRDKRAATPAHGFAHGAKTPPRGGESRGIARRRAIARQAIGTRRHSHDSSHAIGPGAAVAAADRRGAAVGMAAGSGG